MRVGAIFFAAILVVAESCSNPDVTHISDRSYFPLRVGNYQIFQVTQTDISQASCNDVPNQSTKTFELKEITYDSIRNGESGYTYFIHRYTRGDDTQPWTDLDTWSARMNDDQLIVAEGNTPYVKLIFPLDAHSKWNGNLYNNLIDSSDVNYGIYHINNLGLSYKLGNGKEYPTTLIVMQADKHDLVVKQRKNFEVYAASVGLIYREITELLYLQDPCRAEQKVGSGTIYVQSLKSAGRE